MEGILLSENRPGRGRRAYRERIIKAILDTPAGIYGAEVCQHCGEVETFRGYWDAVWKHLSSSFICGRCVELYKRDPSELGIMGSDITFAGEEVERRDFR